MGVHRLKLTDGSCGDGVLPAGKLCRKVWAGWDSNPGHSD